MPYEFLIEYLQPLSVCIKSTCGGYGIYHEGKLLLLLRKENRHSELNGVYIAATPGRYNDLVKEIPSHTAAKQVKTAKNDWIFIPEYAIDFTDRLEKACALIRNQDNRIGRAG